MEVLGLHADTVVERADVQRRFRRLLRVAHPDQGGTSRGAAERIAELREARELLLEGLAATPRLRRRRPLPRSVGRMCSERIPNHARAVGGRVSGTI